ncbi:MAG: hypothetical protein KAR57_08830 [Bacteroidales bacterium]|nr:hypothetical protein [Bacteroidales bacterium]
MRKFNKKLEELKENNKNPFSVPEGYFDSFPQKLQERISSESTEYYWFARLFQVVKPQFALGFMIVAFAVIAITTVNVVLSDKAESVIDSDLYTRIIEVDASEFSEQHFIDVLLEDEKDLIKKKEIETDYYINYLVNEDIDYGTIMDGL